MMEKNYDVMGILLDDFYGKRSISSVGLEEKGGG